MRLPIPSPPPPPPSSSRMTHGSWPPSADSSSPSRDPRRNNIHNNNTHNNNYNNNCHSNNYSSMIRVVVPAVEGGVRQGYIVKQGGRVERGVEEEEGGPLDQVGGSRLTYPLIPYSHQHTLAHTIAYHIPTSTRSHIPTNTPFLTRPAISQPIYYTPIPLQDLTSL